MKLDGIARFGYFIVDKEGNRVETFIGDVSPLKYGEAMANKAAHCLGESKAFKLLNEGRQAGFVNHLDVLAAARFMLSTGATGIFKHTGVCGAAYGNIDEATEYRNASEVDEVARFGGIIGTPRVTQESAKEIVGEKGQKKQDAVVAAEFEDGAVDILLKAKNPPLVYQLLTGFDIQPIDVQEGLDGLVLQERIPALRPEDLANAIGMYSITDKVRRDIIFGFKAADTRHSNAICFVEPNDVGAVAVGISGGASDRITAAYQAMEKAVAYHLTRMLSVPVEQMQELQHDGIELYMVYELYMVSDGFFPDTSALAVATPEEIDVIKNRIAHYPYQTQRENFLFKDKGLAKLLAKEKMTVAEKLQFIAPRIQIRVPLVLNPGGSKKDEEVVKYANEHGMTMLITERDGKHLRCFKHGPQSAYLI